MAVCQKGCFIIPPLFSPLLRILCIFSLICVLCYCVLSSTLPLPLRHPCYCCSPTLCTSATRVLLPALTSLQLVTSVHVHVITETQHSTRQGEIKHSTFDLLDWLKFQCFGVFLLHDWEMQNSRGARKLEISAQQANINPQRSMRRRDVTSINAPISERALF